MGFGDPPFSHSAHLHQVRLIPHHSLPSNTSRPHRPGLYHSVHFLHQTSVTSQRWTHHQMGPMKCTKTPLSPYNIWNRSRGAGAAGAVAAATGIPLGPNTAEAGLFWRTRSFSTAIWLEGCSFMRILGLHPAYTNTPDFVFALGFSQFLITSNLNNINTHSGFTINTRRYNHPCSVGLTRPTD